MRKLLLLLFLLTVLFVSSGQTYEQQSLIPTLKNLLPEKPLEQPLSKLEVPYWGTKISIEERGYYHFVEFLIRKSAHFFIFGLLAVVIYSVLQKDRRRLVKAGLLTLLLAIGDEYHQLLTGGRTPSARDVLLDMAGAITALGMIKLLLLTKKRKGKRTKPLNKKKIR